MEQLTTDNHITVYCEIENQDLGIYLAIFNL